MLVCSTISSLRCKLSAPESVGMSVVDALDGSRTIRAVTDTEFFLLRDSAPGNSGKGTVDVCEVVLEF